MSCTLKSVKEINYDFHFLLEKIKGFVALEIKAPAPFEF